MRSLNRFLAALWLAVAALSVVSATPVAANQFVPAYGVSAGSVSPLIEQAAFTGPRRALLSGNKASGPTYLANFLSGVLPSGVSVSSPSLGGLVTDASGKLTYKPNNLLLQSNSFGTAPWSAQDVTVGTGVADPDGGTSASSLTEDGATNFHRVSNSLTKGSSDTPRYLFAARLKAGTRSFAALTYVESGTTGRTSFNLASGTVGTVAAGVTANITNLGGGWYLCSVALTSPGLSTGISFSVEAQNADNSPFYAGVNGSVALNVYKATVSVVTYETSPRPGDQVITTSSAYYGPAWDYDTSGNALGLRYFPASRTNYRFPSVPDNSSWAYSNMPGTSNSAQSPDGTNNATLINDGTANNTHFIYRPAASLTTQTTVTQFAYIKPGTGRYITLSSYGASNIQGGQATFDLTTGAVTQSGNMGTGTLVSARADQQVNGYWRLVITATCSAADASGWQFVISGAINPTFSGDVAGRQSYIGASNTWYVAGTQAEPFSTAGPYIPTGSAAVTAAADLLSTSSPLTGYLAAKASKLKYRDYATKVETTANYAAGAFAWPAAPAWIETLTVQ